MSVKLTLTLDDQAYAIASGIFPDGAVWLKVTDITILRSPDAHSCRGDARYERLYAIGAVGRRGAPSDRCTGQPS